MRIVLQRVKEASVEIISDNYKSSIREGLLLFIGISPQDSISDLEKMVLKISKLRIFEDENKKMNFSIKDINGEVLIISQFTLFADTKKGNRPGFSQAAPPDIAEPLYKRFIELFQKELGPTKIKTGIFGKEMFIHLTNDGPVTLILE